MTLSDWRENFVIFALEMKKRFNITGACIPELHYMADISQKFERVTSMIEAGEYFVINRPRQYGKTTMLFRIADTFKRRKDYLVFNLSFEGIGDEAFHTEDIFCRTFLRLMERRVMGENAEPYQAFLQRAAERPHMLGDLSETLTHLVRQGDRKLILLIDEVDKSSNNQLFVSFLGVLRDKYLRRYSSSEPTFHSVVLAGVYDVKMLKLKLRPDDEQKYNSPWNIAADFKVGMSLYPQEIRPMLDAYAADKGVKMESGEIAERLFYYTSGYPFLVSKMCKMMDEDILPEKTTNEWISADIDLVASRLIKETNTNFDSLIKNLENNPDLFLLAQRMLIQAESFDFNLHDPVVYLGYIHGIFSNGNGLNIHNRIYREVIVNYMAFRLYRTNETIRDGASGAFVLPDDRLDMPQVLLRFQSFMKEEYSRQDRNFLERQGRLLFLAFMKPILNGHGYSFKEPQISEERRLDIAITYQHRLYIAELKVWRGEAAHERGLRQLSGYLDRLNLQEGFLIVFDHSAAKSWRHEWSSVDGKNIFIVWV